MITKDGFYLELLDRDLDLRIQRVVVIFVCDMCFLCNNKNGWSLRVVVEDPVETTVTCQLGSIFFIKSV